MIEFLGEIMCLRWVWTCDGWVIVWLTMCILWDFEVNCFLISTTITFHLIKKGCEVYLANMVDVSKVSLGIMDVPVVKEFVNIFLEHLPSLPPCRETDFEI